MSDDKKILSKEQQIFFAIENARCALVRSQPERINGFDRIRLLKYAKENVDKALTILEKKD